MIIDNFNVIGKKNNQTLVSEADREILTLGSTENAGNLVKPRFRHYPFTLGLGFHDLHRKPMLDYIYLFSGNLAGSQNSPYETGSSCGDCPNSCSGNLCGNTMSSR